MYFCICVIELGNAAGSHTHTHSLSLSLSLSLSHTHTHTHTQTLTHTYTHTYTCTYTCSSAPRYGAMSSHYAHRILPGINRTLSEVKLTEFFGGVSSTNLLPQVIQSGRIAGSWLQNQASELALLSHIR